MHIGLRGLAIWFCAIGFAGTVWFMRGGEFAALAWNALPYLVVMPLAFYRQTKLPLLTGLIVMLFVDGWMAVEVFMATHSKLLLLMSVLSSVKLFILFPVGFVIGLGISLSWGSATESNSPSEK